MWYEKGQVVLLEGREYIVRKYSSDGYLTVELADSKDAYHIWDLVDSGNRSTNPGYVIIYPEAVHLFKPIATNNRDAISFLRRD